MSERDLEVQSKVALLTKFYILATYDPWAVLANDSADVSSITSMGADWYTLMQYIGGAGAVISVLFLGIRLMITKNSAERAKVKNDFIWKMIVIIALFGFTFIAGTILSAAKELAS